MCVISRKFSKRILRDVISNATPKKKSEHSVCSSQVSREGTFSQAGSYFAHLCLLREDEGQSDELSRCTRKNTSHSPSREYISRSYACKITSLPLERRTTIAKHSTYDVFETWPDVQSEFQAKTKFN